MLYRSLHKVMPLESEKHLNYPDGLSDDTHVNEKGTALMAALIAREFENRVVDAEVYMDIKGDLTLN